MAPQERKQVPDFSSIIAFYNPETGLNYNLIIGWLITLVFTHRFFFGLGGRLSDHLLKLLNKIPFLANTDVDERFFAAIGAYLKTQVLSKMHEAQEIKEEYVQKIAEALQEGDNSKVQMLSKEKREKLEALTKGIVTDFFGESEGVLWTTLINKYGDRARAANWVYKKVKALVEEFKDPGHPSTSVLIAKHIFGASGELGNASSTGKE
jgi:hypothetical protein